MKKIIILFCGILLASCQNPCSISGKTIEDTNCDEIIKKLEEEKRCFTYVLDIIEKKDFVLLKQFTDDIQKINNLLIVNKNESQDTVTAKECNDPKRFSLERENDTLWQKINEKNVKFKPDKQQLFYHFMDVWKEYQKLSNDSYPVELPIPDIFGATIRDTIILGQKQNMRGNSITAQKVLYKRQYLRDTVIVKERTLFSFDVCSIMPEKNNISFWVESVSIKGVKKNLEKKNRTLLFATNAGIFNPRNIPEGLFVLDQQVRVPVNKKTGNGNFFMQFGKDTLSNGIFYIDINNKGNIIKTKEYEEHRKNMQNATQSGPILLYNNEINPLFNKESSNFYIRSGVGVTESEIIFIISNEEVTFYALASVFKALGCANALYLDGAISEMYLPALHRMDEGVRLFGGIIGVAVKK